MRIAIVFNHPHEGSYCNAILNAVMKGLQKANHEIDLFHLDKDGFNPIMTQQDLKAFINRKPIAPHVIDYGQRLEKANHLIFIFSIWWELMSALTKEFIYRALFPGIAYDHNPKGHGLTPLLKNLKSITTITTMNTPKIIYWLFFGNAIKKAMIKGTFKNMRYKNVKWISFNMVKQATQKKEKTG
ncbi:NAD(P)H-dependent oxidoreductase [Flavivirga sp. 57AJ16]|uniref:NAD(P)H-dependent oxidoreductase n=1 Tax=Flavivirga sp. 57AJ16 TaxID=3025307 RepID=UPI002366F27E|nr:NAD(P)H-dependent oxidoreductase [Flavivirga sp. 57AJ16]MDD7886968.1 NAD(P)H-dependent oxidoreductase [Flavivirga sp. 57AJ16]